MLLPHLAFPQLHLERCFPVVGHMLPPHLASPQMHSERRFPVVRHMLLPHLTSSFMDGVVCGPTLSTVVTAAWSTAKNQG